ncbi:MAG: hypothetical protein KIT33_15525 [Candidatus Kapabacteria bacterium]|nr:hypothetical protein [Ignavibacteriota bacterium]MCW5886380.1 hypothetical protein [Candidatus Kapabacteria bacterium]
MNILQMNRLKQIQNKHFNKFARKHQIKLLSINDNIAIYDICKLHHSDIFLDLIDDYEPGWVSIWAEKYQDMTYTDFAKMKLQQKYDEIDESYNQIKALSNKTSKKYKAKIYAAQSIS